MSNEIKNFDNNIEEVAKALHDFAEAIGNALNPILEVFNQLAEDLNRNSTKEQFEIEINNIQNNPSLKLLQRYRMIRNIKREARKQGIHL